MATASYNTKIPQYNGSETSNEDIIYSYFRFALNSRGYSFRVKRTGYADIDGMPSAKSGTTGKSSCDAYIFDGEKAENFCGLLKLESTGKIDDGITQIRKYAKGFLSKALSESQKNFVKKIYCRELKLIVYDGQTIYISSYNLDSNKETIWINKEVVDSSTVNNSERLFSFFPEKEAINRELDEKALIANIARIIRGNEKIQKSKAFVMTVLASIYGQTKNIDLHSAVGELQVSQLRYEQILYSMWEELETLINDEEKIKKLYLECASELYELSQERGMDLYGFIYEELATKDSKKEQGEYYTPRHTIRPLIAAVFENYLRWSKEELLNKNIADIFCGSGGFLYEFVHYMRKKFNLAEAEINNITEQSIYGFDKNGVLSAQLNMYLVGDGETNLHPVNTTINWRKHFLYKTKEKTKYEVKSVDSKNEVRKNIGKNIEDINHFLNLYVERGFSLTLDDIMDNFGESENCVEDVIVKSILKQKTTLSSGDDLGNVDLLITNVPYGKVTDATEQIMENGNKKYGNSLEVNALHECIDLLKPGKMRGINKIEWGGIGIIIVPDSILENATNKSIRDYMIARCDVLAIVSLPEYTFSPYAMEKTYAIVIQKLAPEEFNYEREFSLDTFMYYSCCDGKANSKNRFKTNHIQKTVVKRHSGEDKVVNEFIHNDFEPCFEPYDNSLEYLSKLERAWNPRTYVNDREWDQVRVLETWNKNDWNVKLGRKWGYYKLVRIDRLNKKYFTCKSLKGKIEEYLDGKSKDEIEDFLGDIDLAEEELMNELKLSATELKKMNEIEIIELDEEGIKFAKYELIKDIDMNIDSVNYLGLKRNRIKIEDLKDKLNSIESFTEEELINLFTSEFVSDIYEEIRVMDKFNVIQGTQFSKEDAYAYPGNIPVFTAATDGPAYYVSSNIPGKVMLKGDTLIWSRKGAKAGTIQIFDQDCEFYISDVSGTIMPKEFVSDIDLTFLKYYISGQVKKERQSISNNAQLNKSKVENLKIYMPKNQKELGETIRSKLKPKL